MSKRTSWESLRRERQPGLSQLRTPTIVGLLLALRLHTPAQEAAS